MSPTVNSWIWFGGFFLLSLIMVFAMMEFTVSLLSKPPVHKRRPISAARLRTRLNNLQEEALTPVLEEHSPVELTVRWHSSGDDGGSDHENRFAFGRQSTTQRLHIFLDEERHELRACESASSFSYWIRLNHWIPRIRAHAGYSAGPPGQTAFMLRIIREVHAGGWTFRPVILPFQATARAVRLEQRLLPAPLRNLHPRSFWGVVYPFSYCLAFAWLFVLGGEEMWSPRVYWIILLITVAWWGMWGFITWLICGAPRFWQRKK